MNLEDAETHLPDSINPLSLHIMRLTSGKFEIRKKGQKIREITVHKKKQKSAI